MALADVVTTGESGQAPAVTGAGDSDEGTRVLGDYVALRTRFIDDSLARVTQNDIVQVVLLGAGPDGRAYRLPWAAKTRLFELDTAEMLEFSRRPQNEWGSAPAPGSGDLTKDWPGALAGAGFDRGRPAGWVIEGLLEYLTPAENDHLMARVTQCSAPGSRLIAVCAAGDP